MIKIIIKQRWKNYHGDARFPLCFDHCSNPKHFHAYFKHLKCFGFFCPETGTYFASVIIHNGQTDFTTTGRLQHAAEIPGIRVHRNQIQLCGTRIAFWPTLWGMKWSCFGQRETLFCQILVFHAVCKITPSYFSSSIRLCDHVSFESGLRMVIDNSNGFLSEANYWSSTRKIQKLGFGVLPLLNVFHLPALKKLHNPVIPAP